MTQSTLSSHQVKSRISPWLIRLAYPLGYWLIMPSFFGRLTITGQENIPKTGPVIVAPTHRSRWDALVIPYTLGRWVSGRDLRFMVTSSEITGIQGWFIRRLGGFPIDVNHPAMSSLRHSVEVLKLGEMLVIFPEGGIFRDTQIHPLKRGVARIALEVESQQPGCGVKILPVSIQYNQPYPSWGSDVTVNIGPPLDVAAYDTQGMKSNSEKLIHDLETSLKGLHEGETSSQQMAIA
ncbi:1-acyl-sn-glycerol-3-phosphate acyltransferase [Crocosphaera sp. XPORK-15E]|uniref:lysophospholipid acyltransferase family protein n=1 Tax=Crocosphaera sp. XPORK-15E TaxID=3110247 RepID=UPI002B1E9A07|nr:1-acyl-sn-glycerol-3-phosphate acyltransferase [Crocosphaera sp. XPORK-15E]MEA5532960.1 1-acyl-sn-glycerol-3-phosphate acyltransferase [Crocosphaera sp. XPORK-15E]